MYTQISPECVSWFCDLATQPCLLRHQKMVGHAETSSEFFGIVCRQSFRLQSFQFFKNVSNKIFKVLLLIVFVQYYILTLLDGEVAHGEGHGVAREDVVPAVDVLPVDGETSSRQKGQDPPGYV